MKNHEFYSKYKTKYSPVVNPIFSKRNWWRLVLIVAVAVMIEPFIIYKYQRSIPFSIDFYLRIVEYTLIIVVPFGVFLFWTNWRESTRQSLGYGWMGKFEVMRKRASFPFFYLLLEPGTENELKVNRGFFNKTRVGDFVLVRRDAFGNVEEISRVSDLPSRLAKAAAKRVSGKPKTDETAHESKSAKYAND